MCCDKFMWPFIQRINISPSPPTHTHLDQTKAQFVTNSGALPNSKKPRQAAKKLQVNFASYLSNKSLVTLLPSINVNAADKTVTLTADNTLSSLASSLLATYCAGPEGTQTNSLLSSSALGHQL